MPEPATGCRLPAEWEPQSGVMLTWPHAGTDWADILPRVEPVFARIGAAIARHEVLLVVANDTSHADHIRRILQETGAAVGNLRLVLAPSDDTWARDHGPITCLSPEGPVIRDFGFNGWGGKFDAARDDAISRALRAGGVFADTTFDTIPFILEGGAVETDGQGTLLATRHSVITATRNAGMEQAAVENLLQEKLGIQRFLWLDHGALSGDDTDGHIDTLARFSDPATILYATAGPGDPDQPGLEAMRVELEAMRTADGEPYRLIPLPSPGLHLDEDGRRLPATYANFLIVNGAVLLPVYGVAQDELAIKALRTAFPWREVVAIDCREIIRQNGSLHCLTMQFPAGLPLIGQTTARA